MVGRAAQVLWRPRHTQLACKSRLVEIADDAEESQAAALPAPAERVLVVRPRAPADAADRGQRSAAAAARAANSPAGGEALSYADGALLGCILPGDVGGFTERCDEMRVQLSVIWRLA